MPPRRPHRFALVTLTCPRRRTLPPALPPILSRLRSRRNPLNHLHRNAANWCAAAGSGLTTRSGGVPGWLHDVLLGDLAYHNNFPGLLGRIGSFGLLTSSPVVEPSLAGYVPFFAARLGFRAW